MNDVMTPEDYELLLSLGSQNSEDEAMIQQMLAQVEQLRAAGQAPGMRGNGSVQTAAHPLEFLAALANQNVARQKMEGVTGKRKEMSGRTNRQNQMVTAALLRRNAPATQAGGTGFMPPGMGRPQFSLTPRDNPESPYQLR